MKAQDIYDYLTKIPCGKVVTYGMIADHFGNKMLARAVGNILHKNPDGEKYPCYKVVNFQGRVSDNYAFGGADAQREKLESDGISVMDGKVDLERFMWRE